MSIEDDASAAYHKDPAVTLNATFLGIYIAGYRAALTPRSMETAPRDGAWILGLFDESEWVAVRCIEDRWDDKAGNPYPEPALWLPLPDEKKASSIDTPLIASQLQGWIKEIDMAASDRAILLNLTKKLYLYPQDPTS